VGRQEADGQRADDVPADSRQRAPSPRPLPRRPLPPSPSPQVRSGPLAARRRVPASSVGAALAVGVSVTPDILRRHPLLELLRLLRLVSLAITAAHGDQRHNTAKHWPVADACRSSSGSHHVPRKCASVVNGHDLRRPAPPLLRWSTFVTGQRCLHSRRRQAGPAPCRGPALLHGALHGSDGVGRVGPTASGPTTIRRSPASVCLLLVLSLVVLFLHALRRRCGPGLWRLADECLPLRSEQLSPPECQSSPTSCVGILFLSCFVCSASYHSQ
jgi:hypothetical protein